MGWIITVDADRVWRGVHAIEKFLRGSGSDGALGVRLQPVPEDPAREVEELVVTAYAKQLGIGTVKIPVDPSLVGQDHDGDPAQARAAITVEASLFLAAVKNARGLDLVLSSLDCDLKAAKQENGGLVLTFGGSRVALPAAVEAGAAPAFGLPEDGFRICLQESDTVGHPRLVAEALRGALMCARGLLDAVVLEKGGTKKEPTFLVWATDTHRLHLTELHHVSRSNGYDLTWKRPLAVPIAAAEALADAVKDCTFAELSAGANVLALLAKMPQHEVLPEDADDGENGEAGDGEKAAPASGNTHHDHAVGESIWIELHLHLVEGRAIPKITGLLTREGDLGTAQMDGGRLLEALAIARIGADTDEHEPAIRITATAGRKSLALSGGAFHRAAASAQVISAYDGEDAAISVNPKYVADAVRHVATEQIEVVMPDDTRAVLVRSVHPLADECAAEQTALVMPVRDRK